MVMPFRLGFYDPGKIGYGLIHALMRDARDVQAVLFIKPEHRNTPPPSITMTPTLKAVFQRQGAVAEDLNAFVQQADVIFFCGRARYGHLAVSRIIETPLWQQAHDKKIINVSKGLWRNDVGEVNLPSGHFPQLYQSNRLGMLSGLSFHTTLLNDYPVKMALSSLLPWDALVLGLGRPHRLFLEADEALRAAELYGIMKNPLAIAAGYNDGEDIPVLIGTLAALEAQRVARTFYPDPAQRFSPCYALDDVWGSMTPLSRNFRYGRDLRTHGPQAADIYCTREGTTSLPEGVEGCATWHLYRQTLGAALPPTPLMDAVYHLCQGHLNGPQDMRMAVDGYRG